MLFAVYDVAGIYFRKVDAEQAELLLSNNAASIDGRRRRIRLRLCVELSTARSLLAPRFPISQGSRTYLVTFVGDDRRRLYQHHVGRCFGFCQTTT